nr:uncharacterized protein LOC113743826 [Coffea arabica]
MAKPVLSDRLVRWYLQFQQFEIIYVPAKAVKGQILVDFLADHPIPAEWELTDELPDEKVFIVESPWSMYFDGAAHRDGAGAGVIFYTPESDILPYSFTLTRRCSNNVAEYQALILGLETAVDMKQLHLRVYGDSKLVVIPPMFDEEDGGEEENIYHIFVHEIENEDWRHLIIDYLNHGKLSEDPKKRIDIRRRAPRFITTKGRFTENHSMGYFCDILEKMKLCKQWRRLTLRYVVLNNLAQNYTFALREWDTTGQRW